MKTKKILIIAGFFLSSCSINIKKYSDDFLIRQALEHIKFSGHNYLLNYLSKYPATIAFNPDASVGCVKVNTSKRQILIPIKSMDSKIAIETQIIKGLYIYKILVKYDLEDFSYEIEQLASYIETDYLLLNYQPDEILNDPILKTTFISGLCRYILSYQTFEKYILDKTAENNHSCGYPLQTLEYIKNYYANIKKSLSDVDSDSFYKLMYEYEMEQVKKGKKTRQEAERSYYYLLSEPILELYRTQRKDLYYKISSVLKFEKFYKSELKKFREKSEQRKLLLTKLFPLCTDFKP
ncbi:MAG: hypothetical protein K6357_03545 [Elusimicrobiota bacterium]